MHQGIDLTSIATNSEKFSYPKAICPLVRAPAFQDGLNVLNTTHSSHKFGYVTDINYGLQASCK